MDKKPFSELGLSPETLKAVASMGFEEASPIQSAAIPVLLQGGDVVGQSQTGSGKTAAFAIPAIERVDTHSRDTQVLILCPTRELAIQVAEETAKLATNKKGLRELPVYGGQAYDRQIRGLKQGAHIVIGTPGRIIDHIERGTLKLANIRSVILDEADRMLDMGFMEDIQNILSYMPKTRQTVLFSATVPKPIERLIKEFTTDPSWIKIEDKALTVPSIEQVWYEVSRRTKVEALCRLIDVENISYAVIFCATKMMVDELVEQLTARGYPADRLHGDLSQPMRERVMNRFRKRNIEFLVATDVAARGLDVKDVEVVFNFDLPNDGEDYVHRIGRTGRAGSSGKAITFVAGKEVYKLQNIIKFTKGKIRREQVPTIEQIEERRANSFFESLRSLLEEGNFKSFDHFTDRLLEQGYSPTAIISALVHLREKENPKVSTSNSGTKDIDFSDTRPKRDRGGFKRGPSNKSYGKKKTFSRRGDGPAPRLGGDKRESYSRGESSGEKRTYEKRGPNKKGDGPPSFGGKKFGTFNKAKKPYDFKKKPRED